MPGVTFGALAVMALSVWVTPQGRAQQTSPIERSNIDDTSNLAPRPSLRMSRSDITEAPEGLERLKLAPGFLLEMNVYNNPQMASELRIDEQGDVTVPLAGTVHLGGDTLSQAQNAIAQALIEKEILNYPQVSLNVVQFAARNVSVLGEVQNPGRIQLLAPEPLGDVLAQAGGETLAAGDEIEIRRRNADGKFETREVKYLRGKDSDVLQNVLVHPGDTVSVPRAGVIYVLGAVNRPGGYLMVDGGSLNVLQAVSMANGTTLQASTRWATVLRREGSGYVQFRVPLKKMETGKATPVQLSINDVLYISPSTWKSVMINGSNVLSAATSAAIYRAP